jgi:hypothetical protein
MNESTLTKKNSRVLTNGLLSSKKELHAGYGEESGYDDISTQGTSLHPSVGVSVVRFFFINGS